MLRLIILFAMCQEKDSPIHIYVIYMLNRNVTDIRPCDDIEDPSTIAGG